ncbi:dGTPase [Marinomonas posidonica]|uniref:Probable deoxyguanosinetriphosphate triphosphohydrolase n=1 Tax=Marinomonas posidonica (strain CECT 7376 / NCIMB 14433 / IVIA-Po-181) TaxID=491952 RepID=F6CWD5_MARPP|nr:dGTPase [Marinomonas posidonica]AEF53190.1 deoxyguanosinetriphosphate triphosphohydrolase [Marinomonas posidonica IVIA-Po-181]
MDINFKQKVRSNREYNSRDPDDSKVVPLSEFESDRGRVINSAAIRRLQQKTQVFPLERNAAVRSRLTHSMEVQQVGRFISQTIFKNLSKEQQEAYGLSDLERQFESIIEMSCLMHDVGNPSFGHFGEAAINQWFDERIATLFQRDDITDSEANLTGLKTDLCHFEGNAQALRIVHSLQTLNLTYTQLSGILKYTRRGDQAKPDDDQAKAYLQKKVGFYLSELPIVNTINDTLNIQAGNRSPFAYVMEAADDISYCIADIEDAVEKGILKFDELLLRLKEEFQIIIGNQGKYPKINEDDATQMSNLIEKSLWQYKRTNIISDFFVQFRVAINTKSVQYASEQFIEHIEEIFHGSYNQALLEDGSLVHAILDTLKAVAFKHVFCSEEVQKQELQGYRIIAGLLDIYLPLLQLDRISFEKIINQEGQTPLYQTRLCNKIAGRQLAAYHKAMSQFAEFKQEFEEDILRNLSDNAWELYFRCRLIQDYISGMTDQFAYDEYRALHVIES